MPGGKGICQEEERGRGVEHPRKRIKAPGKRVLGWYLDILWLCLLGMLILGMHFGESHEGEIVERWKGMGIMSQHLLFENNRECAEFGDSTAGTLISRGGGGGGCRDLGGNHTTVQEVWRQMAGQAPVSDIGPHRGPGTPLARSVGAVSDIGPLRGTCMLPIWGG